MASLYRLTTAALVDVVPHKVLSASFTRSAIQFSATIVSESFEPTTIPQIFDIFDAPVKLREKKTDEPLKTFHLGFLSTPRETSRVGPSHSRSIYSDAVGLPRSLPPPIIFDGPACPPHMLPSALKKRRLQRKNPRPSLRGIHGSSVVSFKASTSQSEPLLELFDGPSRITRYPYPLMQQGNCFTYVALAFGLFGVVGWLALEDYIQRINDKSVKLVPAS